MFGKKLLAQPALPTLPARKIKKKFGKGKRDGGEEGEGWVFERGGENPTDPTDQGGGGSASVYTNEVQKL